MSPDEQLKAEAETAISETQELFAEGWCVCRSSHLPQDLLDSAVGLLKALTDAETQRAAANDSRDYDPSWDDRKELLEIWQQHAPLPDIGLREGIYSALLAVARWGYQQRVEEEL